MPPVEPVSTSHIIEKLLTAGGQALVLWVALYYLLRVLKDQYDARITTLETRSDRCEEDRKKLHNQMQEMTRDRIKILEDLLKEQRDAEGA